MRQTFLIYVTGGTGDMGGQILHMRNGKKICNVEKLGVQFLMFCRILCGFVVISVFSRFMRFCVEKNSAKNCARG